MSTNSFAGARELKDIAVMLETIQKMAERLATRNLRVGIGTIGLYNLEDGKLIGYAEPEESVYTFKTVSEHVQQRDDDPNMTLDTSSIPVIQAPARESVESTPRDIVDHEAMSMEEGPRGGSHALNAV